MVAKSYEGLGTFYLGRIFDLKKKKSTDDLVLYDSKDLVTHAVCVGMTGSGKTGLCLALLEEAALDGIPAIVIDPKGDLPNLLLTFPDLKPEDFEPWVNTDDAAKEGKTPAEFAKDQAELWRKGLADWGQDGERIKRLREAVDMAVYTPGSSAGLPVSILKSFDAPPPELMEDPELFAERISTTATSLLGLLGIEADPIKSREHILLSTILASNWSAGTSPALADLIRQILQPPVEKVGVMDVESFFPSKDRSEFAMSMNNLLAAPGFEAWMEGEPLDNCGHAPHARGQAAHLDLFDRPSKRLRENVLRLFALEPDAWMDALAIGHDDSSRNPLYGRDFWLLSSGRDATVQSAPADFVETSPRVRSRHSAGDAEPR